MIMRFLGVQANGSSTRGRLTRYRVPSYVRQAGVYLFGDAIVRAGAFLLVPIYTRILSPAEYGVVAIAALVMTVVSYVAGLSLSAAMLKLRAEVTDDLRRGAVGNTIFLLTAGSALAWYIVLELSQTFWVQIFASERALFEPARIAVYTGCVSAITSVVLAGLQVEGRAIAYRVTTIMTFVGSFASGMLFVVIWRFGAIGAVFAQSIGAVFGLVTALSSARMATHLEIEFPVVRRALSIGLPLTIYAIGGICTDQISRLFIERNVSTSAVGLYNVAAMYTSAIAVVCGAVNTAWVPFFFSRGLDAGGRNVAGQYGTILSIGALALAGLSAIFAPDVLSVFAGARYHAAAEFAPLLALNAVLAGPIWTMSMNPLVYTGQTWQITICAGIAAIVNIGLATILTPRIGVWGAILSSTIALLILNAAAIQSVRRDSRPHYQFRRIATMFTFVLLVVLLSAHFRGVAHPVSFVVHVSLGAIVLLTAVMLSFLHRSTESPDIV